MPNGSESDRAPYRRLAWCERAARCASLIPVPDQGVGRRGVLDSGGGRGGGDPVGFGLGVLSTGGGPWIGAGAAEAPTPSASALAPRSGVGRGSSGRRPGAGSEAPQPPREADISTLYTPATNS